MKRLLILVILLMSFSGYCTAQMPGSRPSTMHFEEDTYDFGIINETDGVVAHVFEFTNTGNKPFVIEKVSVSCGCTVPEYSKAPILPGRKSTIKISYDPANRPGAFMKEIYIISNGQANVNKIMVKGEVIPRPRTVEEDYPFSLGNGLRVNRLSLNYRYIGQQSTRSMSVGYVNTSTKPISLGYSIEPSSRFLQVSAPKTLCAGCKGEITVTYDLRAGEIWGRLSDRVWLTIDDKRALLPLSTTMTAIDRFPATSNAKAPHAQVNTSFYHVGEIKRTQEPTRDFTLTNTGKEPLIVRWVSSSRVVSSTLKAGTVIAPGKSLTVRLTLHPAEEESGTVVGTVTLVTNDPSRPVRDLRVAADLE